MSFELVVSVGDPQGIGPEVAVRGAQQLLREEPSSRIVLCGDRDQLEEFAQVVLPGCHDEGAGLFLLEVTMGPLPETPPSAAGGAAAFSALEAATERVLEAPETRALVTAPLSKEAVTLSGRSFDGHTGWLGGRCGVENPLMLFVAPGLRVALATVHIPLSEVPARLRERGIQRPLEQLHQGLVERFGLSSPRIAVLALNPHAGEGGLLGGEEEEVLRPEIERFNGSHPGAAEGPFSADGFFRPRTLRSFDAVLAMYHDQGLVAVKCLAFGESVNLSLGLPIVRTSVDHGCAYDLVGRGEADPTSMVASLRLAMGFLAGPKKP